MTDVLLTHSYHLYYDRKQTRKMQPYLPLGTLYAAALLRNAGVSVQCSTRCCNDPEVRISSCAETAPTEDRGGVRRQFQLPLKNVPDPHAGGCLTG